MDFLQFIKNKLLPWSVLKPGVTYDILASPQKEQDIKETKTHLLYTDEKLNFLNEDYTDEKEALNLYPTPIVPINNKEEYVPQEEPQPSQEKDDSTRVSFSQLRKIYHNTPQKHSTTTSTSSRIGPANYSAMECHGFYGCIDCGTDIDHGHIRNIIIHTSKRMDTSHMLSLSVGDTIHVVYIIPRTRGVLRVRYITRSKYFSPGSPITSIKVGVEGWEET
jgi:hypothetical protein